MAEAAELFEAERRRLAGMLPGAEIEPAGSGGGIVALVDDLDRPIPVLVERGGYTFDGEVTGRLRRLRRGEVVLTLTDSREELTARTAEV